MDDSVIARRDEIKPIERVASVGFRGMRLQLAVLEVRTKMDDNWLSEDDAAG